MTRQYFNYLKGKWIDGYKPRGLEFSNLMDQLNDMDNVEKNNVEMLQAVLQGEFDEAAMQVDFQNKLEAAEATYAPRLTNLEENVSDISYSLKDFPRLSAETNDKGRFDRAIATIPEGSTLFIPNGEYTGVSISVNRKINLKGQSKPFYDETTDSMSNGVVLLDTKILPKTHSIKFENIGLFSTTVDNGFEGSQGECGDIQIINCVTRVRSHGFLFESYNGENKDILIKECQSYKSTHGFVSKALNVTFENCRAYNHVGGYGFAAVSDNIPGADKKGIANDNKFYNCYAYGCDRGFSFYCRDMFSTNNANNMSMKNLRVIDCKAENCSLPMNLGDVVTSTEHSRINVSEAIIDNFTEIGTSSLYSIRLGLSINCVINDPILSKSIDYDTTKTSRVTINEYYNDRKSPTNYNVQILQQNNNFPRIDAFSNSLLYKSNNTNTTTIKGILGGLKGVELKIVIGDAATSIIHNDGNIRMSRNKLKGIGSYVVLKYDGSNWNEIYSYDNNIYAGQINLVNAESGDIDTIEGEIFDIVGSGVTENVINVINNFSPRLTIMLRSTGGSFSYGGFGNKFVAHDIPTTLTFGTVISADFVYNKATNKYYLSGYKSSSV